MSYIASGGCESLVSLLSTSNRISAHTKQTEVPDKESRIYSAHFLLVAQPQFLFWMNAVASHHETPTWIHLNPHPNMILMSRLVIYARGGSGKITGQLTTILSPPLSTEAHSLKLLLCIRSTGIVSMCMRGISRSQSSRSPETIGLAPNNARNLCS